MFTILRKPYNKIDLDARSALIRLEQPRHFAPPLTTSEHHRSQKSPRCWCDLRDHCASGCRHALSLVLRGGERENNVLTLRSGCVPFVRCIAGPIKREILSFMTERRESRVNSVRERGQERHLRGGGRNPQQRHGYLTQHMEASNDS
jgi:hypothetical protein